MMRYILGQYNGYIGIMEKKMETTIVYWGNMGLLPCVEVVVGLGLQTWIVGSFWVLRRFKVVGGL